MKPAAAVMLFLLFSPAARAGTIIGSPHDFRGYVWSRSGEICTPCHVPHRTTTLPAPLWDYTLSTQTYRMYGKTKSLPLATKPGGLPDGLSKICLSCHDGITASDAYDGLPGQSAYPSGKVLTGPVAYNNHPISFIYDAALAAENTDLYDPSTRPSGVAGSTATIAADMLFLNRMECASCHDVHNTKAVPGTKLLVKDIAGSTLCFTCHDK